MQQEGTQSRSSKFLKDIGIYAIGNLGSKIITFLMLPLYTYFVEQPAEYGYYDICLTVIFLLMPLTTIQLRDGAFRYLLDSENDEERTKIVTMVYRTLFSSLTIWIGLAVMLGFFIQIPYLSYTVALLVVMSFQEVISQVIRGLGNNKAFVAIGILSALGIAIFSLVFVAWLKMGIKGIFLANILARFAAVAIIDLRVKSWRKYFKLKSNYKVIGKEIIRFSLPLIPGSLCWAITYSSDRLFVQHFLGLGITGLYAVAARFASILQTLSAIFQSAWQETAILQFKSDDKDIFFTKIFNSYIYALAFILIAFSFLLKINYGWLVDANYQESLWFIYPMSVTAALFALASFFDMGYQCAKDTKRALPSMLIGTVVSLVLNYILAQVVGVYGIIATTFITFLVIACIRWFDMQKYFKLSIKRASLFPLMMVALSAVPFYLNSAIWGDVLYLTIVSIIMLYFMPKDLKIEIIGKIKSKFSHQN